MMFLDISELQDGTGREWHNCRLFTCNSFDSYIDIDNRYDCSWLHLDV